VRVWLSPKQTVERTVTLQAGQSLEVDWSDLVTATGKDVAKDVAK
jgi:hypothetical protein